MATVTSRVWDLSTAKALVFLRFFFCGDSVIISANMYVCVPGGVSIGAGIFNLMWICGYVNMIRILPDPDIMRLT